MYGQLQWNVVIYIHCSCIIYVIVDQQISEVAYIEKYYQWLKSPWLKDSTEALIIPVAAQEQVPSNRSIEAD